MKHVATVTMCSTAVSVAIPIMDPKSLVSALNAAAAVTALGAISDLSPDKEGGLSGAAEVGDNVDRAADLAVDALLEAGYDVCVTVAQ